jgi:hypothetical protein
MFAYAIFKDYIYKVLPMVNNMDYKFQTQSNNLILITYNLRHEKYSIFSITHRNWENSSLYY